MLIKRLKGLYRHFSRNAFYTIFNVVGLATGLTAAWLILFFVRDELSFDRYIPEHDRIYRLESAVTVNNNVDRYATFPVPLGPALAKEIPEIQHMTRLHSANEMLLRYEEKRFFEEGIYFADSTLFKVFSLPFVQGNPDQCLVETNSIVLTESMAERYFGDENPMGKVLQDNENNSFRVTGILRDLPGNTHLTYDALISMSTYPEVYSITKPSRYWRVILYTYILLHDDASVETVEDKFLDFYKREMEPLGKKFSVRFDLMTTPLTETHFRQDLIAEQPSGNRSYLLIFSATAFFILLIAAINYMNMATARSSNRAKEVGIRKVLGADRGQLIRQFLTESTILSLMAFLVALFAVWILMGPMNNFTGKEIQFHPEENAPVFFVIFLVAILTGLLSGTYPAFYLSRFQPSSVLKGRWSKSGGGSRNLRRILVGIQFFIAVFMVIASLVVTGQMNYLQEKDLGFAPENLVLLQLGNEMQGSSVETFKQELKQHSGISSVSNSSAVPGLIRWIRSVKIDQEEGMTDRSVLYMEADYDFCETFGIELVMGRSFSREMGTDSLEAVLINQTAAYEFGWMPNPLGKRIHYGFRQDGSGGRMLKVIGVVRDFNFTSLHNTIEPILIFIQESPGDLLTLRIEEEASGDPLTYLEQKWNAFNTKSPFRFEWMTDRLNNVYENDEQTGTVIRAGTLFIIILALFGLLGLSSFAAEQKIKEVGIRKIHGATLGDVLMRLYKEFLILFFIAFVVAIPVSWWRLNLWLESEFVYFREITWFTYVYAGAVSILVGLAAISYFIVRAARGNPVDAIKYE